MPLNSNQTGSSKKSFLGRLAASPLYVKILLAVLVLVLIVLKSGRRGRTGRMRGGCGCAPLGWLFSLLGLNVLIDTFRRRS